MVQDNLSKAVLCRLKELGLPRSLIDLEEFRENFFFRRWVMYVRDGDKVVDVHLVQPHIKRVGRDGAGARRPKRDR